jgi:hypothetical protein
MPHSLLAPWIWRWLLHMWETCGPRPCFALILSSPLLEGSTTIFLCRSTVKILQSTPIKLNFFTLQHEMPSSAHTLHAHFRATLKQMWSKFNPAPSFLSIKKLCFRWWWWTQFLQNNSLFFSLALNWGSIYLNYGFHLHVTSFILSHWYSNYYVTSSVLIDITCMNTIRLHFLQSITVLNLSQEMCMWYTDQCL